MGERNDEEGVYNVYSRICHRLSCHTIRASNGRYYARVNSWRSAIELGLKPCENCRPFFLPTASALSTAAPLGAESSIDEQVAANDRRTAELEKEMSEQRIAELEKKLAAVQQVPDADVLGWRRCISKALCRLDQTSDRPPNESLAAQISRLSRQGVIPRSTGAMMRAITELRNEVEHEFKLLSKAENLAGWAIWLAIQEWAHKEGLQL
jgi:hypothetical protein